MKVLLDATAIPADLGGVGRYVGDLVFELINAGVNLALAVQERDAAFGQCADLVEHSAHFHRSIAVIERDNKFDRALEAFKIRLELGSPPLCTSAQIFPSFATHTLCTNTPSATK